MAEIKSLLELRQALSARRPKFLRQDYHHRLKVRDECWRAPKGSQSKMRQKKRGHRAIVKVGYRGPAKVRGLHKSGATIYRIENLQQLNTIDPKNSVLILSSKLGAKKKYLLLKTAIEKGFSIINVNANKFIEEFEAKKKAKANLKEAQKTEEQKTGKTEIKK